MNFNTMSVEWDGNYARFRISLRSRPALSVIDSIYDVNVESTQHRRVVILTEHSLETLSKNKLRSRKTAKINVPYSVLNRFPFGEIG